MNIKKLTPPMTEAEARSILSDPASTPARRFRAIRRLNPNT